METCLLNKFLLVILCEQGGVRGKELWFWGSFCYDLIAFFIKRQYNIHTFCTVINMQRDRWTASQIIHLELQLSLTLGSNFFLIPHLSGAWQELHQRCWGVALAAKCLTSFDLTTGSDSFPGAEEATVTGLSGCQDNRWEDNDLECVRGTTPVHLGKKWLKALVCFRGSKSLKRCPWHCQRGHGDCKSSFSEAIVDMVSLSKSVKWDLLASSIGGAKTVLSIYRKQRFRWPGNIWTLIGHEHTWWDSLMWLPLLPFPRWGRRKWRSEGQHQHYKRSAQKRSLPWWPITHHILSVRTVWSIQCYLNMEAIQANVCIASVWELDRSPAGTSSLSPESWQKLERPLGELYSDSFILK